MEIRRLAASDYDEMVRLWSRAGLPFKPKGRDSKEAVAAEMGANPDFFLGAFEENHLVGIVILTCDLRKGWMNRLAVDPYFRRHGVAKALIGASEQIFRKRGVRLFCALIEDDNEGSKKLFKECDYIEHDEIKYFTKRDNDEV